MPHFSTLIIDRDPASLVAIEGYLKEMDISNILKASDLKEGDMMLAQHRPAIALIVIIAMRPEDKDNIFAFIEDVKRKYPLTSIFMTCEDKDPDLILEAMHAGVDDYLIKPFRKEELAGAIQKITRKVVSVPRAAAATGGKIIAVLGSKGGYGKTTVAVNLAASMAGVEKRPVMIVDLDLEGGDVSTFLNIRPSYTIADVARNVSRLDANYLKGVMNRHESGVYVLAEPKTVAEVEEITAPKIKEILNLLKGMGGYVIVDGGYSFDERYLAVMDMADLIILVGVLTVPAIHNIQKSLGVFRDLGYGKDKVKLLINRQGSNEDIKVDYAEDTLNYPATWLVPNDYQTVVTSINRGIPISSIAPRSHINKSFEEIAGKIDEMFYPHAEREEKSVFKKLFG